MPLPVSVLAALAALPTASDAAAAQAICKPDRIVTAYLHGYVLPRNDAQYKRQRRQQLREQQLAALDSAPVSARYGVRFNSKSGLWVQYIDNVPAGSSKSLTALQAAYPELLHTALVQALTKPTKESQ